MLARIQRAIICLIAAFSSLWAVCALAMDRPSWIPLGLLLVAVAYAGAVFLELVCAAIFNRRDSVPPASASQRLLAWIREVSLAPLVFCWRQPFRANAIPDRLQSGDRPGFRSEGSPTRAVVLVHGFVCNRGFWNPWMRRLAANGVNYIAVNLEPPFGSIDSYGASIDDAVSAAARACGGAAPVIVAHSMGGLAVRAWMASRSNSDRMVHRVITIGTPHRGTWLARFAFTANGRNMALHSDWIRSLALREPPSRYAAFICIYSHCDNVVFPASTATLPKAINLHVPGRAHVDLAFSEEAQRTLFDCLKAGKDGFI